MHALRILLVIYEEGTNQELAANQTNAKDACPSEVPF